MGCLPPEMHMDIESDSLDVRALERLRKIGGEALLSNIAGLFVSHAEPAIKEAAACLEAGDFDCVQRAAHSLKSSAGNLGANQLQNLAARIESLAEGRKAGEIQPLLADLEAAYRKVKARLARETAYQGQGY
jgi:two-component system sensor histidine kinase/response regulator